MYFHSNVCLFENLDIQVLPIFLHFGYKSIYFLYAVQFIRRHVFIVRALKNILFSHDKPTDAYIYKCSFTYYYYYYYYYYY